jgi:predicted RNA binding protein YcfA (HicA-like mRNA interferase family)
VTGQGLPRVLNQRTAKRLLQAHGWTETLGGKHVVKMTKPGHRPITLPASKRRDYAPGLTAAILREAGLKRGGGQ